MLYFFFFLQTKKTDRWLLIRKTGHKVSNLIVVFFIKVERFLETMSANLKRKASIDEVEDKPIKRVAQDNSDNEDSDDGLQVIYKLCIFFNGVVLILYLIGHC